MKKITIVRAVSGKGIFLPEIGEQACEIFESEKGLVGIKYKKTIPLKTYAFVFSKEAVAGGKMNDEQVKSASRWAGFDKGDNFGTRIGVGAGGLGGLIAGALLGTVAGAVGAEASRQEGISGFWVIYKNEQGNEAGFCALADRETVDRIVDSMPKGRSAPNIFGRFLPI
jgi:hypothetical protein